MTRPDNSALTRVVISEDQAKAYDQGYADGREDALGAISAAVDDERMRGRAALDAAVAAEDACGCVRGSGAP
jgi:hypothetical protein